MSELSELERQGLVKRVAYSERRTKDLLRLAERDLKVANRVRDDSPDWAFSIAYNSILQSARALMFAKGYRATGTAPHLSVIRFLRATFSYQLGPLITEFDRLRKKRHISVYDTAGTISRTEMEHAIETAEKFYERVRTILPKSILQKPKGS